MSYDVYVSDGGLSPDGQRWVACKPGFFLPVRVLSRLFRRRFLEELRAAYGAGQLQFFGEYAELSDAKTLAKWLAPMGKCEWVVYAKRPFAGPAAVLAYLSRYTHRVAISNSRLISMDEHGVTFRWRDYRAKGKTRQKTMTLEADEFMRRFLLHVLPGGFHRIRHYGLIANNARKENLALARELLQVAPVVTSDPALADAPDVIVRPTFVYAHCGAPMVIIQTLMRERSIRAPPQMQGVPRAHASILNDQIKRRLCVRHSRCGLALPHGAKLAFLALPVATSYGSLDGVMSD